MILIDWLFSHPWSLIGMGLSVVGFSGLAYALYFSLINR